MSFEIVTDSSCNLPEEMIDRYRLHILSLMFRVSGKEYYSYEKGKITDLKPFYTMMRNKEEITTSLIDMNTCLPVFEELLKNGKDILYIGFSSALSGTYQVGSMVLEDLKSSYPDRKIYYIDTLGASLGEGLLVYHAAELRREDKSIEEVYQWLLDNRLHLCHWFTVDDLFFLKRGGRVSASSAVLGTILGVKPVLHMDNEGRLILMEKARGRKNSLDALVNHMQETAINPEEQMIFITHGDCIEDAKYVENQVRERMHVKDVLINYVDPVIGAHSGPGTVALFFLGTHR
ncbi:DegV family protein [Acetanaerobacterium elongatum]|uniref:EDD domain protein, DegV family n=1 Tax=Acetanaerobacterium elongatum TaxID=258515 RepID=A0A1H0FK20_9FIRM|nr:DegV family protein [Acetanaerobacterium elongatum]SDN95045.1 EDD domain protein, DegV family [Acetanaerobacterium elongatum]